MGASHGELVQQTVTLPVVWLPEANEDLLEARAWYDNIRRELGDRFALAVEAAVEAITENPMQFPVVYRNRRRAGVRRFPLRNILRDPGTENCGCSVLPRQAQPKALAKAVIRLRLNDTAAPTQLGEPGLGKAVRRP